jgi:D-glycero-D-manno-heptose 1,7-bisphosphate phosphatase
MSEARALFLDRDGVINREVGYLHRREDVVWVEGIFSLCRTAVGLGYRLVVVTNQSGIARGYYSMGEFEVLMEWMRSVFVAEGAPLAGVYCCPYHPRHGVGEYLREHEDRKPGPGMLLRAGRELGLDLAGSVLVGDRCTDIAAAQAAGLREAFLMAGTEEGTCDLEYREVESLGEVEQWLMDRARIEQVRAG